jgi:hypothetical protein
MTLPTHLGKIREPRAVHGQLHTRQNMGVNSHMSERTGGDSSPIRFRNICLLRPVSVRTLAEGSSRTDGVAVLAQEDGEVWASRTPCAGGAPDARQMWVSFSYRPLARESRSMKHDEVEKWTALISELQAIVRELPAPNPNALKQFREIEAAFRADPRCTTDVEEALEEVEDGMNLWFGDQDWRELTFTVEQQTRILQKSMEKLKKAALSQLS